MVEPIINIWWLWIKDCQSKDNKEDIVHERAFCGYVDKGVAVCADKISEELSEAAKVGEVENAKADYNYKLAVKVHYYIRNLFQPLAADKPLNQNKQTKVKSPDYIVPACSVPEAC